MNCDQFRNRMNDLEALSREAAEHVEACAECRRWLAEMRLITTALAQAPLAEPRSGFEARLRQRLRRRQARWRRLAIPWTEWGGLEALAVTAVVIAIGFGLGYANFPVVSAVRDFVLSLRPDLPAFIDGLKGSFDIRWSLSSIDPRTWWQMAVVRWLAVAMVASAIGLHQMMSRAARDAPRSG